MPKKASPKKSALFKKGKATSKTIGGKKHVWRKGYTIKKGAAKGKRVPGRWVKSARK